MTDADLPRFETIARLKPIPDPRGRPVATVCDELNAALAAAGLVFEESSFAEQRIEGGDGGTFDHYLWILCAAVRGHCEGVYVHIHLISASRHGQVSRLVALGKSYSRANAAAIAAATQRLLDA